jgi:hypothetical protein
MIFGGLLRKRSFSPRTPTPEFPSGAEGAAEGKIRGVPPPLFYCSNPPTKRRSPEASRCGVDAGTGAACQLSGGAAGRGCDRGETASHRSL